MPSVPLALLGSSRLMARVRAQIENLARFPFPVRLEGPTGSGKGVAARLLHALSRRAVRSFVVCNLAMLSDGTDLDDLVGHRRGAFTGAVEDRKGMFEEANQGTLFIDEVGEASPQVQKHLLRLLDEKVTRRQGQARDVPVDARVVFATNRDLGAEVQSGRFRADLLARMGCIIVRMPSLAEHREDIPALAAHFLEIWAQDAPSDLPRLGRDDLAQLMAYSWPFNVRELGNVMQRFIAEGELPEEIRVLRPSPHWRRLVDAALARHSGNKTQASLMLGVSRQALYQELHRRERRGVDS